LVPTSALAASGTCSGRGATAPRATRAAVQADAAPHHGDIHLGARDEPQVGVGRAGGTGRQQERGDNLALGEGQPARTLHDILHGHLAPPVGAGNGGNRPGGDQGRHAVGRRRAVAQVAAHGGTALDLGGADQVGGLHQAGPDGLESRMLLELGGRCGGTHAEAAALLGDPAHLRDALDVHQQRRLDQVGAQLHEEVGAPRQDARLARLGGQQRHRLVKRSGCLIAHASRSSSSSRCPARLTYRVALRHRLAGPAAFRVAERARRSQQSNAPRRCVSRVWRWIASAASAARERSAAPRTE
jgi:hypothetical protein